MNVCFKDAVMGTHRDGTSDKEVSNFILQGLGMVPAPNPAAADSPTKAVSASSSSVSSVSQQQQRTCPTDPDRTVLILQRRNRRLLNAEELAKLATAQGLFGRVVEFDGMPVVEQIFTVSQFDGGRKKTGGVLVMMKYWKLFKEEKSMNTRPHLGKMLLLCLIILSCHTDTPLLPVYIVLRVLLLVNHN
jgi:hypothetical protein